MNPLTSEEIYKEKFKNFLSPEDAYQFYLKIQFMAPKMSKESDEKFFEFISFALKHFKDLKENESYTAILDLALSNYIKSHPTPKNADIFLETFVNFFKLAPVKSNKTFFKCSFLDYCDKNKMTEKMLDKFKIYEIFAMDSIENEYYIQGYRFSLKSKSIDLININLEKLFISDHAPLSESEKMYLLGRTCLELLLMQQEVIAKKFIEQFLKSKKDFSANHPIINYSYLLCCFLNLKDKNEKTYDNFKKLNSFYKPAIKCESSFYSYIDKVGKIYFNKSAPESGSGFSLMNLLRAFTG